MSEHAVPSVAEGLSPVPKHVYHYLSCEFVGPRTHSELCEELRLASTSVSRACNTLLDEGLVTAECDPRDGRMRRYRAIEP